MAKSLNVADKTAGQVVIVEDEAESRKAMSMALRRKGYHVEAFADGAEAIVHIKDNCDDIDVVITDLRMPGVDGLTVVRETKQANDDISVILVTAFASVDSAVEAMKQGADDYLTKPIDLFEFRTRVSKLFKNVTLNREVEHLQSRLDKKYGFECIIGKSAAMEEVFDKVRAVAGTKANVLILGESGTGKELFANALHQNSKMKTHRFLPINCAAIPGEILESELFGHERGSFTGAINRKIGKFELASPGTIFLDEIGDMNLDLQVKLLRVLENREFMRVGGSEMIKLNTRFVFATNTNLEDAVSSGDFREDLYYRINVVSIRIPPLRERTEDIPLLINHYLDLICKENDRSVPGVAPDVMERLVRYSWPGNVRELRNAVENMAIFCQGDLITLDLLPATLNARQEKPGEFSIPAGMTMDELEREAIYQTLDRVDGNKTRAAEILGIGLRTLQRKLKDYEGGNEE
ncbi:MAG: sigma-54 dependent transcriptional regulator [Acidobacteriota bacterium]|nr:sigma-54 dependent transcriptional regulator [Acidobacteriota bacterium]